MTATIESARQSASGYDLMPLSAEERERLAAKLTPEERRVMIDHGTEPPFCSGLLDHTDDGVYACRLCALPLFRTTAKFESGTGWPSFYAPFDPAHVREIRRHQPRHDPHRNPLRALRRPSRPHLPRRPATNRKPLLHEFGGVGVCGELTGCAQEIERRWE